MKVTEGCESLITAITADTAMKNTINNLMINTCCFSFKPFLNAGLITSSVKVELDVKTSDESVDIEAERTNTITIAITMSGKVASIAGTIVSNKGLPVSGLYTTPASA